MQRVFVDALWVDTDQLESLIKNFYGVVEYYFDPEHIRFIVILIDEVYDSDFFDYLIVNISKKKGC